MKDELIGNSSNRFEAPTSKKSLFRHKKKFWGQIHFFFKFFLHQSQNKNKVWRSCRSRLRTGARYNQELPPPPTPGPGFFFLTTNLEEATPRVSTDGGKPWWRFATSGFVPVEATSEGQWKKQGAQWSKCHIKTKIPDAFYEHLLFKPPRTGTNPKGCLALPMDLLATPLSASSFFQGIEWAE